MYVAGAEFPDRTLSVLRLTSRGSLDHEFGNVGIARLPHHGVLALPTAVAVQPDGRILLAGDEGFSGTTPPAPCGFCEFLTVGRLTSRGRVDPDLRRGGCRPYEAGASPRRGTRARASARRPNRRSWRDPTRPFFEFPRCPASAHRSVRLKLRRWLHRHGHAFGEAQRRQGDGCGNRQ